MIPKTSDMTMAEWIEVNQTPAGGWRRDFFEEAGLGWPPPKHWKRRLERGKPVYRRKTRQERQDNRSIARARRLESVRENAVPATKYKGPNASERAFAEFAESEGWEATKRGWPDFACFRDGKLMCVEVKPGSKALKKTQHRIMEYLQDAGLKCYRWDPERGFTPIDYGLRD